METGHQDGSEGKLNSIPGGHVKGRERLSFAKLLSGPYRHGMAHMFPNIHICTKIINTLKIEKENTKVLV